MRVILVQPGMRRRPMDTELKSRMAPSLGLLTIAGMLYQEHEVILLNENIEKIDFDIPADLVGIIVTVDVMPRAIQIAREFKKRNVPSVAGGIHISAMQEKAADFFDGICIGMAEGTWPFVMEDMKRHQLKKVYRCRGDLNGNDILGPAYDFIDRSKYLYTNVICTSRGCPFQCDFCYNSSSAYKGVYLNRPVEDIINEIKKLGTRHIMFVDDNFIGNPGWTKELIQQIKPLKLKWNAAVSANIADMPKLLDDMKASGCQSLFIGFESLNRRAVSGVHKAQNQVDKFQQLVEEIHKRGIMINASFVFGLDGDNRDTFRSTLDWIIDNKIETVTSHILTPYPGTRLYERFLEEGRITDFDLSKYNTANVVFKPAEMSSEELLEGYLWIYKEIYRIRNIIRRLPKDKSQWLPYLAFNLFYRKFGKFTAILCRLVSFQRIGWLARWVSYHIS